MEMDELVPGAWPDLSKAGYARLVRLAESRLVGYGLAGEDVVSRSVIKWRAMSACGHGVARIEQVVKSEAASWRRSEDRRRAREQRYVADPSGTTMTFADAMADLRMEIRDLEAVASRQGIIIDEEDRVVLAALLAGVSISDVARQRNGSRYRVLKSRDKWRLAWSMVGGCSAVPDRYCDRYSRVRPRHASTLYR